MNICLYGASSSAISKSYITSAEELGAKLALRGHSLIFGGGAYGLMGAAARGAAANGGRLIGIVPSFFQADGMLFKSCDKIIYTDTMRDRKQMMEKLSDAFIVTPGGPGTMDEFFEILTLKQLGRHTKPIAVFNINGYFDNIRRFLDNAAEQQFMTENSLKLCHFFGNADKLLGYLEDYKGETAEISQMKKL